MWGDRMPTIDFYNYAGENNVLDKSSMLGTSTQYTGDFRDAIDLHNPVFTVNDTLSADFNYCSITADTTRYYFCTVENVRTGLTVVRCNLDVLMTYKSAISNCAVTPLRSGDMTTNNGYIYDGSIPFEQTMQHFNVPFTGGTGFDYGSMSMIAGIVGTNGDPTNY